MTDEEILRLLFLDPFDPFVGVLLHPLPAYSTDFPSVLHDGPVLPPIAGGAPDSPWEWAWDRIQDLLGAGYDLLETIGRIAADIVQGVWEWVGGAVRFVYDWLSRFSEWLGRGLSDIWGDVRRYPWDAAHWVKDRVDDAARWVKDRVDDAANFVGQALINTANWIRDRFWEAIYWARDRVWDAATWVKDRVWDAATWVKDRVWDAAHWVSDETWKMVTWAGGRIDTAASWTVNSLLFPIMGGMGDIGDAFRDAFDLVGGAVMDAGDALRDGLVEALKWPWDHMAEPLLEATETKLAIPGKLFRGEYSSLQDLLDDALDPVLVALPLIVGALVVVQTIGLAISSSWETWAAPMFLPHQQATMARVGAALLTVGVVQEALNRGFIDEATAVDHLSRQGYSGQARTALLELRNLIPSPTDLIRMAVREVFNPQLRQQLTLDAEYPDALTPWARQLGYSEEWAGNFWAAHWDLPSPSQGYEMLHRGLIDEGELAGLLKALDYAPVWRDKLQAISYAPITRVDLRRLYKGGVITEDDVFRGYKALGYNDERARWLTDWTKEYYSPEDRSQLDDFADLAASTYRTAYRRGTISREAALDRIVEAGYTEAVAEFLLAIDDADLALNPTTEAGIPVRDLTRPIIVAAYREKVWSRERAQQELETLGYLPWAADLFLQLEDLAEESELRQLEEAVVKEEYTKRTIDRVQASNRLDALEVGADRRDLLLRRWDLQAANKTRELTVAQVQRGLKDGAFTEAEALSRFSGMGYNELDAKWLVDDIDKTTEGTVRRLSASQLSQAYKAQAITDAQFLSGLLDLKYSQADAEILLDIATPAAAAKERQLSAAQLAAGLRAGLLAEGDFLERVTAAGYAQPDAELLRDLAVRQPDPPERKLSVANIKDLYKAETLDKAGVLAELLVLGYSERNAGWIRDLIAPAETTE